MMSDNGKWQIYAEAAAISYKSEQQISYWQLARDPQYVRLLRRTSAGPFKSGTGHCEYSYAVVDDELIISFPGTRNGFFSLFWDSFSSCTDWPDVAQVTETGLLAMLD